MTVKRHYRLFIDDIKNSIYLIEKYLKGIGYKSFMHDNLIKDSVKWRFIVINLATNNIPSSYKRANKNIPWKYMSSFRKIINSDRTSNNTWKLVKDDLPKIKEGLKNIKLV